MIKIEAPTLEEAYNKAAQHFSCSVKSLQCEIVQHPSSGVLGLFKKPAIIIATYDPSQERKEERYSEQKPTGKSETLKQETSVSQRRDHADTIVDEFFKNDAQHQENETIPADDAELAAHIEAQIRRLMEVSCFDIDVVEVDVADNTAYIFIDGEDAALLIGKEGYRFNALSYMLFNWINGKYGLYIKLEIAQFYTSQQEMMRHMLAPLIEEIHQYGKGRTRYLDGILVQIALELLRAEFPDKYVAIKKAKNGQRFVVVNDFYSKQHG